MLARWKDLCIDANDVAASAAFWGAVLNLSVSRDHLTGVTPGDAIWVNKVREKKTVKNRVHLDVHTASVQSLTDLGAQMIRPAGEDPWTVLADPDGQEFCAFVRDELPAKRLYELVVDCEHPAALAQWWSDVLGGRPEAVDDGDWSLGGVPDAPFEQIVFETVPEGKTVKNRVHWDVIAPALEPLVEAGATLLRPPGGRRRWNVLADPEGNEFCAFIK